MNTAFIRDSETINAVQGFEYFMGVTFRERFVFHHGVVKAFLFLKTIKLFGLIFTIEVFGLILTIEVFGNLA